MSEWDRIAKYQPAIQPERLAQSQETQLSRPYVAYWINTQEVAVPLSSNGFHLRKGALRRIREHMRDNSSAELNHHTRFYIHDTSWPHGWQPDNPHCWTPIAENLRDQWVPGCEK